LDNINHIKCIERWAGETLQVQKQSVVDICRTLLQKVTCKATEGNVSVRVPDENAFAITLPVMIMHSCNAMIFVCWMWIWLLWREGANLPLKVPCMPPFTMPDPMCRSSSIPTSLMPARWHHVQTDSSPVRRTGALFRAFGGDHSLCSLGHPIFEKERAQKSGQRE
jgi:hypothetical protein